MKKMILCFLVLSSLLISCEKIKETNMENKNKKDITVDTQVSNDSNIDVVTVEKQNEATFMMSEIANNKDKADLVYSYDVMDNYGETTTVIPSLYNNKLEDISNFELEYNFIKNNEIVYSITNIVNDTVKGNGGFLGMPVFLADIPISDFDKIEITMKK